MTNCNPLVSIGLPVYNNVNSIRDVLDSLLSQSFTNFELIISDNYSNDGTQLICEEYAQKESRITYVRQSENIGAALNFRYVVKCATGKYFMWAAGDDIRSTNFLEVNVLFLECHPDYVASTSPNCFEGEELQPSEWARFSIEGSLESRFQQFLRYCWKSNGIFYSLIRMDILHQCEIVGESFTASDWAIILYLISKGNIKRNEHGLTILGKNGISNSGNAWRAFRKNSIEKIFPLWEFTFYAYQLSKELPLNGRIIFYKKLLTLNLFASFDQMHAATYLLYKTYFK